jgi:hypothetical protein
MVANIPSLLDLLSIFRVIGDHIGEVFGRRMQKRLLHVALERLPLVQFALMTLILDLLLIVGQLSAAKTDAGRHLLLDVAQGVRQATEA